MEIATANALFRYFEELYGLNQNVIALCGINVFDITDKYERRMDEVMITIPRLVPYGKNKKSLYFFHSNWFPNWFLRWRRKRSKDLK